MCSRINLRYWVVAARKTPPTTLISAAASNFDTAGCLKGQPDMRRAGDGQRRTPILADEDFEVPKPKAANGV